MNEHDLYCAIGNLDNDLLEKSEQGVECNMNKNTKSFRQTMRVGLIAAAILCISAVSVYAVGNVISIIQEKIGFFKDVPAQTDVADSLSSFRGNYDQILQNLESFNAPVGQSVTDNGITITLDGVSMDISSVDLFFTLTGEDAIKQVLENKEYYPMWYSALKDGPYFDEISINGEEICQQDAMDWYQAEDGSLKFWKRYLLKSVPKGDEILLQVNENFQALGKEGNWGFSVSIDTASVLAGAKEVKAGAYPMPGADFGTGLTQEELDAQTLQINKIAFGSKSGVFYASYPKFLIKDDTGKELYLSSDYVFNTDHEIMNLTLPDAAAKSITLTPVVFADDAKGETKTLTSEEMKQGVKFETNTYGGYTVQNYQIKDHSITFDLVPFGWTPSYFELVPQDEGKITYHEENEGKHSALQSRIINPETGVIRLRYDYYAASQEQLESIIEWSYYYTPSILDTEHALTLELVPVSQPNQNS